MGCKVPKLFLTVPKWEKITKRIQSKVIIQSGTALHSGHQPPVVTEPVKCVQTKLRCDVSVKHTPDFKDLVSVFWICR